MLDAESTHRFTPNEDDWGFAEFIKISALTSAREQFMPDGNLHIRVNLKVKLEEKYPGVTRQLTGYVGHKNQVRNRHSCHTPCRRDCAAEYSQTLVSTKQCVQSFSGTTGDAFMQLDVEELELKLCDKLEEKVKGASLMRACFKWVKCATGKRLPGYAANVVNVGA